MTDSSLVVWVSVTLVRVFDADDQFCSGESCDSPERESRSTVFWLTPRVLAAALVEIPQEVISRTAIRRSGTFRLASTLSNSALR